MDRVKRAIATTGIRRIVAGGGVAANSELRRQLRALTGDAGNARGAAGEAARDGGVTVEVVLPPPELCVDNGAMVAGLGYQLLTRGDRSSWDTGVFARVPEFRARK
jgi:N6-L-threonylcarbamoyladenine synthase